jgi:hypothetical protein
VKRLATAEEIQAAMQADLNRLLRRHDIPAPMPIHLIAPSEEGNWTFLGMVGVPNDQVATFLTVVRRAMQDYDLKD